MAALPSPVLIAPTRAWMARLSRPGFLVEYHDSTLATVTHSGTNCIEPIRHRCQVVVGYLIQIVVAPTR